MAGSPLSHALAPRLPPCAHSPTAPVRAQEAASAREAPSINLPRQRASPALLAIDIGGSLIKIVYFSPDSTLEGLPGGRLHFVKFETSKVSCQSHARARPLQSLSTGMIWRN